MIIISSAVIFVKNINNMPGDFLGENFDFN